MSCAINLIVTESFVNTLSLALTVKVDDTVEFG